MNTLFYILKQYNVLLSVSCAYRELSVLKPKLRPFFSLASLPDIFTWDAFPGRASRQPLATSPEPDTSKVLVNKVDT